MTRMVIFFPQKNPELNQKSQFSLANNLGPSPIIWVLVQNVTSIHDNQTSLERSDPDPS